MSEPTNPADLLIINESVRIPRSELAYRYARSSAPGGQHTNKTETAVELLFDLAHSPWLTEPERALATQRLARYLDSDGMLHLESQSERSQLRNRDEVTQRFAELLRQALRPVRPRRQTRPSRASRERRLAQKRYVAEVKTRRRRPTLDE